MGDRGRYSFIGFAVREKSFLVVLGFCFLLSGIFYQSPVIAAWLGFLFAGYAAIGNDSIQTLGTFIASNRSKPWWMLWLFTGTLFLGTVGYSWLTHDGDVSYGRLMAKGFEQSPTSFSFLQVAAPLFLLILTRLRMPVSTTFLLLTSFAATASSVGKVLVKSLSGYALAFGLAFVIFILFTKLFERYFKGQAHPGWRVAQWITTGTLWCVWLMQDAANIAVYLPRKLSGLEFAAFAGVIFLGLGLLFRIGGEKIQRVVDEKSNVIDVRAATIIDFVYAVILFYFKIHSKIPMSTTWVFIGLLGGRELAIALRHSGKRTWRGALGLLLKDITYVGIGLIISIVIAAAVNDAFRAALVDIVS